MASSLDDLCWNDSAWVWWSPGYGGHLGMGVTWVWWSPGYGGHLGMVVT